MFVGLIGTHKDDPGILSDVSGCKEVSVFKI